MGVGLSSGAVVHAGCGASLPWLRHAVQGAKPPRGTGDEKTRSILSGTSPLLGEVESKDAVIVQAAPASFDCAALRSGPPDSTQDAYAGVFRTDGARKVRFFPNSLRIFRTGGSAGGGRRSAIVRRLIVYGLLGAGSLVFLLPLIFMISSSLKPDYQVFDFPPRLIPNPAAWQNYPQALTYVPFGRFALNTLIIAVGAIIGNLLSCTLVAYGFARLRAPGREALFMLMLATMMLPYPVTMIPVYIIFKTLRWVNTFLPLIAPAFFGSPFYIFLLRQFFLNIPRELEDAALIDGASRLQILYRIIIPLAMPALAAIAIFNFQGVWNDFLPPLLYLHDRSKYTIALGLNFFRSTYNVRWGYLMAACVVTMLPVVVVFFLAQKQFIEGISVSGLKG